MDQKGTAMTIREVSTSALDGSFLGIKPHSHSVNISLEPSMDNLNIAFTQIRSMCLYNQTYYDITLTIVHSLKHPTFMTPK